MTWFHWSLLSALFAALTALFAKMGIKDLDPTVATAIRTSVVVLLSWVAVAVTGSPVGLATVSRKTWAFLILSGTATGLSWLFYFRALNAGPLSRVAPVDKLSVVLTVLLGVLILGEMPTLKVMAGVVLITLGVTIIAID